MNGFDGDIRDMLGCASHVEVCGICGICGICGTDHLPEIGPWGLPFFGPPPQSTKGGEKERQTPANQKGMLIFHLNC